MTDTPCTQEDRAAIVLAAQNRMTYLHWLADLLTNRWGDMDETGKREIRKAVADELRALA